MKFILMLKLLLIAIFLMVTGSGLNTVWRDGQLLAKNPTHTISNEDQFLSRTRQLTFEGRRSGEGYFSSDGSQMIFQSERAIGNPFFQIYLMSLKTGGVHRVSPGYGKTTCGWIAPDGQKVLFASTHADSDSIKKQQQELQIRASGQNRRYTWDFDEHFDIYEFDQQGNFLKKLTDSQGYDAEASWSPDGRLIAFSSNRHAYEVPLAPQKKKLFSRDKSYFVDLYLMKADGSEVRRLTQEEGYDGGPFFSPDGESVCWRRFSKDGSQAEIYVMRLENGQPQQITNLAAMSWAPYFHPSGDYLIFTTNLQGAGNFELYLVDAQGKSKPIRVTFREGFDGLPSFSPDGHQIAWTSNRTTSGQSQLFLADWNDWRARDLLGLPKDTDRKIDSDVDLISPISNFEMTSSDIFSRDLMFHVRQLSADQMEGRLTGTKGGRIATEYVASVFEGLSLQPAGDNGSYFQNFEFVEGVSLGSQNSLKTAAGTDFKVDQQWRPLAFSQTGRFGPAEIVFAGYGIVAPEDSSQLQYDSYAHLDVKGKWVMVLRYLPENISPRLRQHLGQYASLRYKSMVARDRGAIGLVVVSGPNAHVKEELVSLSFDASQATAGIAMLSITNDVAKRFLQGTGHNLSGLQNQLDQGDSVMGFELQKLLLESEIDIQQQKAVGRNVLARISGGDQAQGTVVVGAHIDHLGRGLGSTSLAGKSERGMIHYGADDNASGVAGVIEIAQYLSNQKSKEKVSWNHHLLVAAWSGEELGLLGSTHFVKKLTHKGEDSRIGAYLNMDMIGRFREKVILQGVGSSSFWLSEIEKHNVVIGLPLIIQQDSYLPTDATAFYLDRVPILNAFTGVHEDYHTPRDTSEKINYQGAERIVRLMAAMTKSILNSPEFPDYVEMKRPGRMGSAGNLRAYLGTIPDYSRTEVAAVTLSGIIKGGPADQAGVQKGDQIVELADTRIQNIYDYTYAINSLKIGVAVRVVLVRDGKQLTLKITPRSRE